MNAWRWRRRREKKINLANKTKQITLINQACSACTGAGNKPRGEIWSGWRVDDGATACQLWQIDIPDKKQVDIREQWFTETLSIHWWCRPSEFGTNSLVQWIMGNWFRLLSAIDMRFILMWNMQEDARQHTLGYTSLKGKHPPWKTLMHTHHVTDMQIRAPYLQSNWQRADKYECKLGSVECLHSVQLMLHCAWQWALSLGGLFC